MGSEGLRLQRKWFVYLVLILAMGTISLAGIGCVHSSRALLKDRYLKLAPLSQFEPKTCKIETTLSEPVKIKYLQLYPSEGALIQEGTWHYTWTALESRCEVTTPRKSNLLKSHRAILNAAFCTLLQAHWVNSPFDEFLVESQQIEEKKDLVFIRQGLPDLGVSVYSKDFLLETNTKKLGLLRAHYSRSGRDWLPDWLEQKFHTSVVRVDQMQYRDASAGGDDVAARKMLDEFWISVGADEAVAHTFVKVGDCY